MKDTPRVVVYGASGYTGKLICWKLAERGIPFVAAGRSMKTVVAELGHVPELAGATYECSEAPLDEAALTNLFRGKTVVYNVVGPFMQLSEPVVRAALAAGCHYLDTTGETDWMRMLKQKYGEAFRAKGLLLAPACSWMWAGGLLAAEIALERAGIDSLDIVYLADSATSQASTMSFMRICTRPQHYLEDRKLALWPFATPYDVVVPGVHTVLRALPWSGGGETIWLENDPRVRHCTTLVAFRNQEMFGAIVARLREFEEKYRHLPDDEQEKVCSRIGNELVAEEPARENPEVNRCIISCHARGNTRSTSVVLRGTSPYIQTGVLAAEASRRILAGRLRTSGFASPAAAFGARELAAALAEDGLHAWVEEDR